MHYDYAWCMLQIEGLEVSHKDITIQSEGAAVAAVQTMWPVGARYDDAGATAFDEADGFLEARRFPLQIAPSFWKFDNVWAYDTYTSE